MQKAVGYIWLAPEQVSDEAILKADQEALRVYCQANSMELTEIVVEHGTQGAALERPLLKEMMAGEHVIIIPSLAALGRRFHDVATVLSEVNFLGRQLISCLEDI